MTPYIIALAALALLLARTARKKPRERKVIGKCINAKEDEKGVTFTLLLTDTELLQKFNKNADTYTHDFSCATQQKKSKKTDKKQKG